MELSDSSTFDAAGPPPTGLDVDDFVIEAVDSVSPLDTIVEDVLFDPFSSVFAVEAPCDSSVTEELPEDFSEAGVSMGWGLSTGQEVGQVPQWEGRG